MMEDKSLQKVIAKVEYEEGKAFLRELEKEKVKPKEKRINFSKWLAAAGILLLVGMGAVFLLNRGNTVNTDTLYAEYYESYPNNLKPVVRGNADPLTEAFTAYENAQYDQASNLFQELLAENENTNLRFYYALSLLAQDKPTDAIHEFDTLTGETFRYQKERLWYTSLAYLKVDKKANAKQTLEQLNNQFPDYRPKDVKQLLKKM